MINKLEEIITDISRAIFIPRKYLENLFNIKTEE